MKAITHLAALENYLNKLQEASDKDFQTNYSSLWESGNARKFEYTQGAKWIKVIAVDMGAQKSVFCFIDPQTGDIYKAAGWHAPAKGIRGNIFNEKLPLTGGALYR